MLRFYLRGLGLPGSLAEKILKHAYRNMSRILRVHAIGARGVGRRPVIPERYPHILLLIGAVIIPSTHILFAGYLARHFGDGLHSRRYNDASADTLHFPNCVLYFDTACRLGGEEVIWTSWFR